MPVIQIPRATSPTQSQEQLTATEKLAFTNNGLSPPERNFRAPTRSQTTQSRISVREAKMTFEKVVDIVRTTVNASNPSWAEELKRNDEITKKIIADREKRQICQCAIEELRNIAWEQVQSHTGSPESSLADLAKRAFDLAKEGNNGVNLANLVSARSRWLEVFTLTWELTWKECWEASWTKILNDTLKIVWDRGFLEGISTVQDRKGHGNPIIALPLGYEEVKNDIGSGGLDAEHFRRIRSMFKALDLLHRALAHSVPTSHQNIMKITIFDDEVGTYKSSMPALYGLIPSHVGSDVHKT